MRNIIISLIALFFFTTIVKAQDFSYLKDIDLNDTHVSQDAQEAAMECCCYLVAVRYDKKDVQRQQANEYITQWVNKKLEVDKLVCDAISIITGEREELVDMFLVYCAMNYMDSEQGVELSTLKQEGLLGLWEYCSNSKNKLKPTKELKLIKQYHNEGTLDQYLQDIASVSM